MRRYLAAACLAGALLFQAGNAHAAEKGLIIRAGKLLAQPFIDAAGSGAVTANQPVVILERRGAWVNVDSNGTKGWVRLLNVRLEPRPGTGIAGKAASANPNKSPLSIFQTNTSKQTVTTGIKGADNIDEESIRNASVDYEELDKLGALGVDAGQARTHAAKNKLIEQKVGYLKKGDGK